VKILFFIVFFDLLGFGLFLPVLPFFAETLGATPTMVIWAGGAYSLGQFVAAPVLGRLSDRYGRRPLLLFSLAGSVASYVLLLLADSYAMLLAARLIGGITAGNIAVAFAYVADVTKPQDRAKAMGFVASALSLGFILGPSIGGLLGGHDAASLRMDLVCGFAILLAAAAFVLTALRLPESRTAAERAPQAHAGSGGLALIAGSAVLLALVALNLLVTGAGAMMESSFVLWSGRVLGYGPQQVGLIFAFMAIITTLVQALGIGPLRKRAGEVTLMTGAVLLYAAGLFVMSLSHTLGGTLVSVSLIGVGMAIFNPCASSLVSQSATPGQRGGVIGLFQSAGSLARVLGPAASGPLFQFAGPNAPFAAGALLTAPAAVIVLLVMRHRRVQAEPSR
jgi:DHA1 family tetracycline resistance protein-like MFS transporter